MSELRDSILTVMFDGEKTGTDDNGKRRQIKGTTNLEEWSIESNYLGSTDGFSFTYIDENPENLRDLECKPVSLYINGALQLIGRIDQTHRGDHGRAVTCKGRDYRADLVECNIDPTFVVKEGETLGSVIVRAGSPVGISRVADGSDIATVRNVRTGRAFGDLGSPPNFQNIKQQEMTPDPGQGIYEFLKKIIERHGCTIQPDVRRDSVLIAGPMYRQDVPYRITRSRASTEKNNVDKASATRDYSSFPSIVISQGHGSPRHGEATKSNQAIIDTWSLAQGFARTGDNNITTNPDNSEGTNDPAFAPPDKPITGQGELGRILNYVTWTGRRKPGGKDGDILAQNKIYRLNWFRDQQAKTDTQLEKAARRLLNEHLKNTLIYEVELIGHIDPYTKALWSTDTMVDVNDDVCDVHELLWVMERTFIFNNKGAKTKLRCIRPGSFEI